MMRRLNLKDKRMMNAVKNYQDIKRFARVALFSTVSSLMLTACATSGTGVDHNHTFEPKTLEESSLKSEVVRGPKEATTTGALASSSSDGSVITPPSQIGSIPVISDAISIDNGSSTGPKPKIKAKTVDAFVPALSVPEFIDVVFGEMLDTPYVTGPDVANRKEIIQLRSSGEMTAQNFLELVSMSLEEYGVRIVAENGAYLLIDDKSLRERMPRFIKSRARLRTRNDLRPVIQFVELQALSAASMNDFLRQAFGVEGSKKINIRANQQNNYITLSGLPEDVDAAIAIIRELDALNYAGRQVQRYTPRYWNSTELTEELSRALTTEGWQVSTNPQQVRTISLMPVEYSNDIFIFTTSDEAYFRVQSWIRELDRPVEGGDTEQIFIYQVKNVDAVALSGTANSVLQGAREASEANSRGGNQESESDRGGSRAIGQTAFTVDPLGNRIIFSGTASDYDRYISLLEQLDSPSPEVLIEVQIAEVTLTDNTSFGAEFFIDGTNTPAFRDPRQGVDVQTGGLGLGSAGVTIAILTGNDVEASINAFASNRQVKVLSTPILIAKSGGSAQIQVGTDVPILTSQGASAVSGQNGATTIQQNVEYRSTGILLSIEPIVFSDDRIDLTVSQEVSSTLDSSSGGISSPTISSRTVSTQLSLEDGATAVLGGLIQENYIRDERGIPILKDIPFFGSAFSADTLSLDRTELVILITAYVLRGQVDKEQFVNRLSRGIDEAVANDDRRVTLLPRKF